LQAGSRELRELIYETRAIVAQQSRVARSGRRSAVQARQDALVARKLVERLRVPFHEPDPVRD
jgi:hypothetical protein